MKVDTVSVAGRPEVDFDQYSDEFAEHRHEEWAKMRQCPVAHNACDGGFWVVSGYDEVVAVSRDAATFSSKYEEDSPDGIEYIGIMGVPRMPGVPSAKIAEVEGPTRRGAAASLEPLHAARGGGRVPPLRRAVRDLAPRPEDRRRRRWTWSPTSPTRYRPSSP